MGLAVDGANRHDMKLVRATVDSLPVPSPETAQGMCLDKGYDFNEVRRTLDEFGFTAHIRARRGPGHQESGRLQSPTLGGGDPQLDEPLPADTLQPTTSAFRLRPHRAQSRRVIR